MFERLAELNALEKQEKKQSNTSAFKKAESLLKAELRDLLDEYLTNRKCESVTLEVREQDVVDFLAILQKDVPEYECEQISETLYKFSVKSLEW